MPSEVSTVSGGQSVEELRRELAEAREQQAATAEILRVISSSPMDLQGVFAEIAASAAQLCAADDAVIFQVVGDGLRLVAHHGPIRSLSVDDSMPLIRGVSTACAVLDRRTVHVADIQAETAEYPQGSDIARRFGIRTVLHQPLIRAGKAIGVISIRRTEVRPFTDRQIELVKTFADQAVIAIENTRLFEEVQARTKELQDSLDRQTATSEVLGIISRSPNEVQPVLDTIVATARRLCQAERAVIWRLEGETFRAVAHCGQPEERVEAVYGARGPVSRGNMVGRAILARRAVQVEDVATDPELLSHAFNRAGNVHTVLAVPLLLKGHPIGIISLTRTRVARFDDKQVALVEAFADQAVIAIENARLFQAEQASKRELTEALEQQTATADVLKVISRSALDVQKVLDALVESAARLCNAYDAAIYQVFGDGLRLVAHHGPIPVAGAVPLSRGVLTARAVIDRRTMHVEDLLRSEADEYPESRKRALQHGYRTLLAVPLVHAGEAIGAILIRRAEARPFTDRQIELVNTFADQAVIAIENTRLFDEVQARTRELAKLLKILRSRASTNPSSSLI
jgi:GAF domain-containing protein